MAKNTTTRWDALSMRDRASLIKLYSQSGIRKLDDMRAHYNSFGPGGALGPVNPNVVKQVIKQGLLRLIPERISVGVAGTAEQASYGEMPSIDMWKNAGSLGDWIIDDANKESKIQNPGNTFLLDRMRQKELMEKMGYKLVDAPNYGPVNKAASMLNASSGDHIPIYQLGNDEVNESDVEPIGDYVYSKDWGEIAGGLTNAYDYPIAIYKHKNTGDIYVRGWDLNDYGVREGSYIKSQIKNLPITISNKLFGTDYDDESDERSKMGGIKFGGLQWLANIYDYIGNPFVQRTGLVKAPEEFAERYKKEDGGPLLRRFATGGDKDVSKNLAYKIGAYAHDGAGITPFGILDALTSKQKEYDELKAFIYGPETAGYTEYTGLSRKPFFNKQAKVYNGNINPNNEYVFPENMKGFLEEVASRNGNIYLNADLMPGSEKQRYDAANYPLNLQFNSSGNIIGNAADLYDFDPDYTKRYKEAHKWQAKIMEKQGNPYIVRQDNIPFRFVEDVDDKDAIKTLTAFSYGELGSPADISDAAIVNTMERLGNGTIEPSVVKANLPTYYEYYNADNYANGGKIYIKPKNRGKFNALLKRTGKSASWFKEHGTPLQRKRATFALNAKKWKHADGGVLDINTKFFQ